MGRPAITWVTTDWHFGHRKMEAICGRPYLFESIIYSKHRETVHSQDNVINLGDLLFYNCDESAYVEWFNSIAGSNTLVLGNHDRMTKTKYRKLGFDVVCEGIIVDGCLLTHKPTPPPPGLLNIHGHWHNLGDRIGESPDYDPSRQFCLSLERTKYRPIDLRRQVVEMRRPDWVNPWFPDHRKEIHAE